MPPDFEGAGAIIRNRVSGHPNVARFATLIEQHAAKTLTTAAVDLPDEFVRALDGTPVEAAA